MDINKKINFRSAIKDLMDWNSDVTVMFLEDGSFYVVVIKVGFIVWFDDVARVRRLLGGSILEIRAENSCLEISARVSKINFGLCL